MTHIPLVEPFLLANTTLLNLLILDAPFFLREQNTDRLREAVYLGQHSKHSGMPDHVFQHRWLAFLQEFPASAGPAASHALFSLSEQFLYMKENRAAVILNQFGEWQNLLSRMSGLPVQAALFAAQPNVDVDNLKSVQRFVSRALGASALACPYDAAVEDYIRVEGLHESHLHLNGTTLAEMCWQRALIDPMAECKNFDHAISGAQKVQELMRTVDPELTPSILLQHLQLARTLRAMLLEKSVSGSLPKIRHENLSLNQRQIQDFKLFNTSAQKLFNEKNLLNIYQIEAYWLCLLLKRLRAKPDIRADRMLQLYLLIQNQYLQLMVQRDDFFGFDQFQKFTFAPFRWQAEESYAGRFWQMHGYRDRDSHVGTLEGRFAPKGNLEENQSLIYSILKGYWNYLKEDCRQALASETNPSGARQNMLRHGQLKELLDRLEHDAFPLRPRKMELALVVHFIKLEWSKKMAGSRHAELRADLRIRLDALLQLLRWEPRLRSWIRGIDAAANESHATPEVFAPIFRIARFNGIAHATYHAGEDFIHLIGGIRQVDDALTLLDMQPGDRIGHATALGLHPRRWLGSMPNRIAIKRGEWMIDMLCAWDCLRRLPFGQAAASQAASEAMRCANAIFQSVVTIEHLHAVMRLRGLWPNYVFDCLAGDAHWNWRQQSLDDGWRAEARLVADQLPMRGHLALLERWWRAPDVLTRSEEFVRVDAGFLPEADLIRLQQAVLGELVRRDVIIETLPTSNVRISQYQHVREHHVLRWAGVPGHKVEGDPEPMVSLGSDDPGIFATDLRSEFYHLYSVLRNENGMSDVDALKTLATINERGRIYRFHSQR